MLYSEILLKNHKQANNGDAASFWTGSVWEDGRMSKGKMFWSIVLFVLLLNLLLPVSFSFTPTGIGTGALNASQEQASQVSNSTGTSSPYAVVDVLTLPEGQPPLENISIPEGNTTSSQEGVGLPGPVANTSASQDVAIRDNITGLGYDGPTPPDVQVAAGPQRVVEMDNREGRIFNKNGGIIRTFSLRAFFSTGTDFIADPKLLFDAMSGRWFTSLMDKTTSSIRLGVAMSTPIDFSRFCFYSFPLPSRSNYPDQPLLGVSNDKVALSANVFTKFDNKFLGAQVWIINKSQLVACATANLFSLGPDPGRASIYPVQSLSSTTTQFMVDTRKRKLVCDVVDLYSFSGVPPGPITVFPEVLCISALGKAPAAIQRGGMGFTLDTGDTRVLSTVWWKSILWLAYNSGCTVGGVPRSCIHLVQIGTSTKSVLQDFNFGAIGQYYFYPSVQLDTNGNLLVVFGFSSNVDFPGIRVTEQAGTDPRNTLQRSMLLKAGEGPVILNNIMNACTLPGVCRYGDYFGSGLDPSTPTSVWVAAEYGSGTATQWATQIGEITG